MRNWCYEIIWNQKQDEVIDLIELDPNTITYTVDKSTDTGICLKLFIQYEDKQLKRILYKTQICRPDNLNLDLLIKYSKKQEIPNTIKRKIREAKLKRILK